MFLLLCDCADAAILDLARDSKFFAFFIRFWGEKRRGFIRINVEDGSEFRE